MLLKNYVGTRVGIDSPESKRSNYIQKDRISDTSPPVVSNANHQLGAVLQPLREPIDFFRDAKQQEMAEHLRISQQNLLALEDLEKIKLDISFCVEMMEKKAWISFPILETIQRFEGWYEAVGYFAASRLIAEERDQSPGTNNLSSVHWDLRALPISEEEKIELNFGTTTPEYVASDLREFLVMHQVKIDATVPERVELELRWQTCAFRMLDTLIKFGLITRESAQTLYHNEGFLKKLGTYTARYSESNRDSQQMPLPTFKSMIDYPEWPHLRETLKVLGKNDRGLVAHYYLIEWDRACHETLEEDPPECSALLERVLKFGLAASFNQPVERGEIEFMTETVLESVKKASLNEEIYSIRSHHVIRTIYYGLQLIEVYMHPGLVKAVCSKIGLEGFDEQLRLLQPIGKPNKNLGWLVSHLTDLEGGKRESINEVNTLSDRHQAIVEMSL